MSMQCPLVSQWNQYSSAGESPLHALLNLMQEVISGVAYFLHGAEEDQGAWTGGGAGVEIRTLNFQILLPFI